jgi:outer membrane protein OmpA-like peptidoglycan-associated protein
MSAISARLVLLTVVSLALAAAAVPAQAPVVVVTETPQAQVQVKSVTATRESMALSYPEGTSISIRLQGTHRLPMASGEAKVERRKGETRINISLDNIKPASFFGGDYNTYVLWTVAPEGHVANIGEFIIEGDHSKLQVTTPLETFGMFVTAEPHFLVASPSRFVVIENTRPEHRIGNPIQTSQIRYRGFDGMYRFERESLANMPEIRGERREDIGQARSSVNLADRAGAARFAADDLVRARESLSRTEDAVRVGADRRNVMLMAHEVVRLAYDAQKKAEERSFQAALDAERKAHTTETARLEGAMRDAQNEADRQKLQAEQRELQLRIEEQARRDATRQAEESARRAAEAAGRAAEEERRRLAEERRRLDAEAQAKQLAAAKSDAELAADRARQEAEASRKRMHDALSQVAETRETARGLIVNIPDILFDFNKATLRPQGRETLAKIAGILLVARGYNLKLEGHTDSIGGDAYNQKLSEDRAAGVRDYLVQSGLSSTIIAAQGFGKTRPVASNDTAQGRQRNRRVEIVIEGVQQFSSNR